CLDLFAGTGALGIEALSRGAASCVFVERDPAAVRVIRENLERTRLAPLGRVIRATVQGHLRRGSHDRPDLVFLDPPYDHPEDDLRSVLGSVDDRLVRGGRFVLTRPKTGAIDVIPVNFQVERRLSYGDAVILVCREGR
ncbi:MAG TPA: RsmD family RNA methyltransferase, partial [Actinomycetota bacterium]|nr:RsmD family RNA methyltransferase [Actinomycetota bacterium]